MPEVWAEDEMAKALGAAFLNNFGPCACHMTGMGNTRTCAMHNFIDEVDKRSVPIPRVQRLIFVRAIRDRLLREEGFTPSPVRTCTEQTTPQVLPW